VGEFEVLEEPYKERDGTRESDIPADAEMRELALTDRLPFADGDTDSEELDDRDASALLLERALLLELLVSDSEIEAALDALDDFVRRDVLDA
jgi:hypothetical protein